MIRVISLLSLEVVLVGVVRQGRRNSSRSLDIQQKASPNATLATRYRCCKLSRFVETLERWMRAAV